MSQEILDPKSVMHATHDGHTDRKKNIKKKRRAKFVALWQALSHGARYTN
jgi:hypothetical protein